MCTPESAAYDVLSLMPESEWIPLWSVSAPLDSRVASTVPSISSSVFIATSPSFLATVTNHYFQFHCRHSGVDPCHFLPDSRPPPLLGYIAWSTIASWQVCGPLYGACCPGYRTRLELDEVVYLPQEKLLSLQNLIGSWLPQKWCNRHEFGSLIGHLHHAAKVVWHSYAAWLTCYADFGGEITPFVLTENSIWIFYGGTSSWMIDTALASGSSQDCCPRLMLKCHLMLQAWSAMEHTWRATGLLAPGLRPSSCSLLPTRSSSL